MGIVTQPKGGARANKVKDMSIDELEYLIEQKILKILGDFDSRIELADEFKKKLAKRLKKPSGRISHKEVLGGIWPGLNGRKKR